VYRQRANAARGTGESCLPRQSFDPQRGAESTSLTQPFPSRLGLSWSRPSIIFRFSPTNSVLSMNWNETNMNNESDNDFLSTLYSPQPTLNGNIQHSFGPIKSASKSTLITHFSLRKNLLPPSCEQLSKNKDATHRETGLDSP